MIIIMNILAQITAAFAYGNVQIVATAGAETRNPRKAIVKAVKQTFVRVILVRANIYFSL